MPVKRGGGGGGGGGVHQREESAETEFIIHFSWVLIFEQTTETRRMKHSHCHFPVEQTMFPRFLLCVALQIIWPSLENIAESI